MDLDCSAASLQTLNVMDILVNFKVGSTLKDLYRVPGQLLRCGIILLRDFSALGENHFHQDVCLV